MSQADGKEGDGRHFMGIGVSPGVVVGPVYLVRTDDIPTVDRKISAGEVDGEIVRFEQAVIETRRQLLGIQEGLKTDSEGQGVTILDAHLMVLNDPAFLEGVVDKISREKLTAETVVRHVCEHYSSALSAVEDDYMRERVADVKDVGRRLIRNLTAGAANAEEDVKEKHIIIARDLTPSETATFRKELVIGFATDLGSPTSHTAVLARALEIPAIVGLHDASGQVRMGDQVLIDGNKGMFVIRPTEDQLKQYGKVAESRRNIEQNLAALRQEPAETADGYRIVLSANVEQAEEVDSVIDHGAEGIGLFRSEYLYMAGKKYREEDEQAKVYTEVAGRLAPAPVIIRTTDLGGDKFYSNGPDVREANPFLGCRSIRISLAESEMFKTQLRAIIRSNVKGNVKVMYPMISSVDEVKRANEILEEAKEELGDSVPEVCRNMDVGAMIEIPSAALTADVIAEQVQFLSIGTNDLIQYTIAVDRVNEQVAYLYEPTHPAVLQLIKMTIDAGHRKGIWVGLCGEMAADPLMTALLIGLGVDELSVAPSAVPLVKDAVRSVRYVSAKELAEKALECRSAVEVLNHCKKLTKDVAPEILEMV
ncbi:MAG: phosphoenolpyruvate--protein phosphotransferase [Kiritimatiellia bacterium]